MVSIIMPAYNGERFIKKAVQSVIDQSYYDWELIIIDDCSTDKTREILSEINDSRIQLYFNAENHGIAYTRNRGLELAQGEYIALLDDDDIFAKTKLAKQVSFLDNHPQIDILGTKVQWIDENDNVISSPSEVLFDSNEIRSQSLLENPFCNCEVMFRRKIIEDKSQRYFDNLFGMEDYNFWIRCLVKNKATNLDDVLFFHRITSNNETARVAVKNESQKTNIYNSIRKSAFELNGIKISDEQFQKLAKHFSIFGNIPFSCFEDFKDTYLLMHDIYCNADTVHAKELLTFLFRRKINATLVYSNEMWWKNESNN